MLLPSLVTLSLALAAQDPNPWTGALDEASFAALHDLKDGAAPALRGDDVKIGDDVAYLSRAPGGQALGAVIVIHEWWGLNDHVKHWADRLASDGYDALAVDLYGGIVATTREEAMAAMRAVSEEKALATLRAAHRYLVEDEDIQAERTASIGWCFGGAWSLRLAMAEPDLDAAVLYYGRLVEDPEALATIEAPVLGVFGNRDGSIPPEAVERFAQAMKKADKPLELRQYDAEHAFANPSGARYDEEHAADAWLETRKFLVKHLTPKLADGSFARGTRELELEAPGRWSVGGEKPMRLATLTFGSASECSISAFPGEAGGIVPNIARWCQQLGEDPLSEEEVAALPRTPCLGQLATVVRIEGRLTVDGSPRPSVLLGAIVPLDGETVFVKLTGPSAEVDAAADDFRALCRGMR
jgi:carboxymethylenebutenolidase